jgi:HK97 gp10 family phage protein
MDKNDIQVHVLFNNLPMLIAALVDKAGEGLEEGAQALLDAARPNVPVITGALRDSGYIITSNTDTYDDAVNAAASDNPGMEFTQKPSIEHNQAIIGYAANYAIFVHDGTMYMAGNPFLLDAANRTSDKFADGMKAFVERKAMGF